MTNYHLDYETFSAIDLREVGAYRYAEDDSTEILMFAIATDTEGPYLWINPKYGKSPTQDKAAHLLKQACVDPDAVIWAHSAQFEIAITWGRLAKDFGNYLPSLRKWRCTAALARRAGLPARLADVAQALELPQQKDKRGEELIKLFSIPQPKTGLRILPTDLPDEFKQFGEYCLQDVRTEQNVHQKLKPFEFSGALLEVFLFDLELNHRGIPVNVTALHNAKDILDEVLFETEEKFAALTGLRPTQRAKVQEYLANLGMVMEDMTADTVKAALDKAEGDMNESGLGGDKDETDHYVHIYDVLDLYSTVQYAAAKKVYTMLDCVCKDGYVRGTLQFYGAATGRWSGRLIQPQNFKKPTIKGTELAYQLICEGFTRGDIEVLFDNALEAIASCIRNFIQPHEGVLFDADYNAIEARIVCWLAGQEDVLDMYRKGRDLYKYMAGMIYNKPETDIVNPSTERELGKRTILGCGFNMGGEKFQLTCAEMYNIHISRELADKSVAMYRELCWKVQELWGEVDLAARSAISRPGQRFTAGPYLTFQVKKLGGVPYLLMGLPSGRSISYPFPKIELTKGKHGLKHSITFFGEMKNGKWGRVSTYGGKLVENATQGTAFDIMGNGSVNASNDGYKILTLIHDQAPAFARKDRTVEQYCESLTRLPPWAKGLPIKAEGRVTQYYKK